MHAPAPSLLSLSPSASTLILTFSSFSKNLELNVPFSQNLALSTEVKPSRRGEI